VKNAVRLKIILVRPRNPDNIGAAARAMANFGLAELALVNAFDSDWREAEHIWRSEASVSAIGSMEIIDSARLFGTIPEAAADCQLLLGTSSLHRMNPERDVILLSKTAEYLAARGPLRAGILFGAEKTGLTKEELSFCQAIINVPTLKNQPSMNLGQAVAVVAYELAARGIAAGPSAGRAYAGAAPMEIERMVRQICEKLKKETGPHWGGEAQAREIRRGLVDARLTKGAMNALKRLIAEK